MTARTVAFALRRCTARNYTNDATFASLAILPPLFTPQSRSQTRVSSAHRIPVRDGLELVGAPSSGLGELVEHEQDALGGEVKRPRSSTG